MVMNTLKRDDILKVQDIKLEKVVVPEWGGEIFVKELNGEERNSYEAFLIDIANGKKAHKMDEARARIVALSVCDEDGNRLFTDDDIPQIEAQERKGAHARVWHSTENVNCRARRGKRRNGKTTGKPFERFCFRLALALGMTVRELLARVSSSELSKWIIYESLEPFGSQAQFIGNAIVATTVANRHRGKNEKPHKVSEFVPVFERKHMNPQQMLETAGIITQMYGGADKRVDEDSDGK